MTEFIIQNWYLILAAIAVLIVGIKVIYELIQSKQLIPKIQEWLLYAVIEAEKALGEGTGEAKLRLVYDMMIAKFPAAVLLISFAKFKEMVDIALAQLEEMLKDNVNLQHYIDE